MNSGIGSILIDTPRLMGVYTSESQSADGLSLPEPRKESRSVSSPEIDATDPRHPCVTHFLMS